MDFNNAKAKDLRKIYHEGDQIISDRLYNFTIGIVIAWGFLVNTIIVTFFQDTFVSMNPAVLLVGYFVLAIAGIVVNRRSKDPVISFIGYNLLVAPVGAVLSVVLVRYNSLSIFGAIVITGAVTVIMLCLSITYPKAFLSMGRTLFIALTTVIIIELISIFAFRTDPTIIDWIVAFIFCGYIGYDWAKAQQYQKTLDNAVDSAFDIYLDIINLFLRILEIVGKKK